jgi:glycosyltransferase involved in cell wall biosynthesis
MGGDGRQQTMLLVLPVPFREQNGALYFEAQACNGLKQWAASFAHVTVAAPAYPELLAQTNSSLVWKPVTAIAPQSSFTFLPLPWAYDPSVFWKTYGNVRRLIREEIPRSTFLQFAIGNVIGDWAAVAALEAIRQKRPFAIHTDRVEHQVLREVTKDAKFPRRMKALLTASLMKQYHHYLIRRCSLGLWHGSDCYQAYAPFCRNSHLVHDIHTGPADAISQAALTEKLNEVVSAKALRVCYAGRLDLMKAPLDWLKAIAVARDRKAPIQAVWFGEGSLRKEAEEEILRLKLGEIVSLPGFVQNRELLLANLRASHAMLFTHVTQESPRCLIEALISGTPIIGYENRYAEGLTSEKGGGSYTPLHDWQKLGERLAAFAGNRREISSLIRDAAENGRRFNDVAVFRERSELIKRHCLPG